MMRHPHTTDFDSGFPPGLETPTAGSPRAAAWRAWLPLAGSIGLVSWLVWKISPGELLRALQSLNWPLVVVLTLLLVIALYCWDSLCLRWLFSTAERRLRYGTVLRARGTSYLFAIINYGFGQALLAWLLAEARRMPFLAAAARCVLIAVADIWVLLSLGLIGSLLSADPRTSGITRFCSIGLMLLLTAAAALKFLPTAWLERARQSRFRKWFEWPAWHWRPFAQLCGFRIGHIGFGILYLAVALPACGLDIDRMVVISVLPMVALIEGLPISVAGIGTREAALLFLLQPEQPATLVAFCLVWSASVVTGRALIGVANLWHPATRELLARASRNLKAGNVRPVLQPHEPAGPG